MGRLFDAVSSLLGLRQQVTYEAQAAIDLEFAAIAGNVLAHGYRFTVYGTEFDPRAMLRAIVDDLRDGVPVTDIARTFHVAVVDLIGTVAEMVRAARGLDTVALTGGVFQNRLLTELCVERLEAGGFTTLTHRLVPPNDGGLALGQAYIAAHRIGNDVHSGRPDHPTNRTET
jgi:hydrogenase maturation protein HypF